MKMNGNDNNYYADYINGDDMVVIMMVNRLAWPEIKILSREPNCIFYATKEMSL